MSGALLMKLKIEREFRTHELAGHQFITILKRWRTFKRSGSLLEACVWIDPQSSQEKLIKFWLLLPSCFLRNAEEEHNAVVAASAQSSRAFETRLSNCARWVTRADHAIRVRNPRRCLRTFDWGSLVKIFQLDAFAGQDTRCFSKEIKKIQRENQNVNMLLSNRKESP